MRLAEPAGFLNCGRAAAGQQAGAVTPSSINPNDTTPPAVTITPGSGTVGQSTLAVTIAWCDDNMLVAASRHITLRGADVTTSFSYTTGSKSGCKAYATSAGTIALVVGGNYLNASIQDGTGNLGQSPATYTYVPPYQVAVSPKGGVTPPRATGTGGYTTLFTVQNTGSATDTYTLTCGASGPVTCAAVSPASASLAALASLTDTVTYAVGAPGTGLLTLTAASSHVSDAGSDTVPVTPPLVLPAGPVVARDLCLTIAAGPGAAYECGGLRLVHALPATRRRGTWHTPTLLYESGAAAPVPATSADLALAATDRPDSIVAIARLAVGGVFVQRGRAAWAGGGWGAPGQAATRRLVVLDTASDLATGLYPYRLELDRLVLGSGLTTIRTDTGTLALVNRAASPFGAGWWLAGFEQLQVQADSAILWIGGDGSMGRYVRVGAWGGATWYVARALEHPDTLSFDGTTYTRYARAGTRVLFDQGGFHTQTVNRLGAATVFAPDANRRLASVTLPGTGAGRTYTFTYNGPNGTLSTVNAPDSAGGTSRVTTLAGTAIAGGARIASITDPGIATSVQFAYGNASYPAAVTARTDRRGATTTYRLGPGLRLLGDSLPVSGAAPIVRRFCPAEIRPWVCGAALAPPESSYTRYDGPRTDSADVTDFWLDSLGAVTAVRDAYGQRSTITRGDAHFPALATRVQAPSGRVMGATYDPRGNLASVTDSNAYGDGRNPTTQYTWDQRWDQLTSVTLPNGQRTTFGVDSSNGNRLWVQDARGPVSRTTFQYIASGPGAGLLGTVVPPLGARTTITYDGRGNPASVSTGGWTTSYKTDSIGRSKVVLAPIGSGIFRTDTTTYDGADRVVRAASYGPAAGGAAAALLTTVSAYDAEGNRDSVQQSQSPDPAGIGTITTRWVFDAADRAIVEIAPDGQRDSSGYDPAGNVVVRRTRTGSVLAFSYDRMNRLVRRVAPAVTYAALTSPGKLLTLPLYGDNSPGPRPYPWYPNNGTGLTIAADTARFTYDAGGRMLTADNSDARVHRTWFAAGQIATDSLWIRNYSGTTFGHTYGLRYSYDLDGRAVALHHPAQLAAGPAARDSVRWVYSDTTGDLVAVTSLLGNTTSFFYDVDGRLVREAHPGGIVDSTVYDSLGRATLTQVTNGSGAPTRDPDTLLRQTTLQYATDPARVSGAFNTHGWKDTVQARYTGMGYLASLSYARPRNLADSALYVAQGGEGASQAFTRDPLGNSVRGATGSTGSLLYGDNFPQGSNNTSYYHNGTGRIDSTADGAGMHGFVYDSAGNTRFFYQTGINGTAVNDRASWYGAAGRLRAAEWRDGTKATDGSWNNGGWNDVFEEYRYDALGRRVLVMSRWACWRGPVGDTTSLSNCAVSRVRRTVWAGARELWEIQMPAGAADSLRVENDTARVISWAGPQGPDGTYGDPNPLFGRVAYGYGLGVDAPVSVTRFQLVRRKTTSDTASWPPVELAPNWNWRGEADLGTFADGGMTTCTNPTHCVFVQWRGVAFATGLASELLWTQYNPFQQSPYGWFGTLLTNKEDGTGTYYRRNRSVDPMTGRFTQEDPLGLAGGLNLYGFAAGDPVTYSDPFGLWPGWLDRIISTIKSWHEADQAATRAHFAQQDKKLGFKPGTSAFVMNLAIGWAGGIDEVGGFGSVAAESKAFSAEKQALVDMANHDKHTGMTPADMQAYKELNGTLPDPFPEDMVRGPETHPTRGPAAGQPHGHVGPVNHIPIRDPNQ